MSEWLLERIFNELVKREAIRRYDEIVKLIRQELPEVPESDIHAYLRRKIADPEVRVKVERGIRGKVARITPKVELLSATRTPQQITPLLFAGASEELTELLEEKSDEVQVELQKLRGMTFEDMMRILGREEVKRILEGAYTYYSLQEIGRFLGVHPEIVRRWFKQLNIATRPPTPPPSEIHLEFFEAPRRFVYSSEFKKHIEIYTKKVDEDTAWMIGFILSDGSINETRREAMVYNTDWSLYDRVLQVLEKQRLKPTVEYYHAEKGVLRRVKTKAEANFWRILFPEYGRILTKADGSLNWDNIMLILDREPYAYAFIGGFWDGDGSILDKERPMARVSQMEANKDLLELIMRSLNKMTVETTNVYLEREAKKMVFPADEKVVSTTQPLYALGITKREAVYKFLKHVQPYIYHSEKSKRIKSIIEALS